jgi:hypothetical protein
MFKVLINQIILRQKFDLLTYQNVKNTDYMSPQYLKYHLSMMQAVAKKELQIALSYHYIDTKNKEMARFVSECNNHLYKLYGEASKV